MTAPSGREPAGPDSSGARRAARLTGIGDVGPFEAGAAASIPARAAARVIWVAVAILIVATFSVQFVRSQSGRSVIVDLFDANQKLNFPTAMKVVLLLGSTVLFVGVGLTVRDRWHRIRWFGIGAVFAFLSLDEMTYMHQRISDILHESLGTSGPLQFAWVLVYLPLLAVLTVVYLPFWRRLANPLRTQLLLAAIGFAGGSGGLEFFKAALFDDERWKLSFGLVASTSDSLELLGLALLVSALLNTIGRATSSVNLTVTP